MTRGTRKMESSNIGFLSPPGGHSDSHLKNNQNSNFRFFMSSSKKFSAPSAQLKAPGLDFTKTFCDSLTDEAGVLHRTFNSLMSDETNQKKLA